ncbi:MAG: HAMP domain-containing histidine kinase [Chloroflexi bacterium]|nr:HAMP domain-containing histidine kinase [Chloroflexota bacterium]
MTPPIDMEPTALFELLGLPWAEFSSRGELVKKHPNFPPPDEVPELEAWLQPDTAILVPPEGLTIAGPGGYDLALLRRQAGGFWAVLRPRDLVREFGESYVEHKPFLNMLVHELRLPVTVIKGYTDLMQKGLGGPLSERQAQFLDIMSSNVKRLERLLEFISMLSKVAHRRLPFDERTMTLQELVEDVEEAWANRWAEKQLTYVGLPDAVRSWRVKADPQYTRWILHRLFENAWAYTPEGGRVWLDARRNADGTIDLIVADTGIGVAEEDQERLFQPFFRSPDERVRAHKGWGLALHVARALAQELGGDLGYTPRPRGSAFWLRLPSSK